MSLMFIGEKRSRKAVRMGVRWENGALAAKTLFDALLASGIDPSSCRFINLFERGTRTAIRNHSGVRIAMGRKVQRELEHLGIEFIPMTHPAARGTIRKRANFHNHVSHVLAEAQQ